MFELHPRLKADTFEIGHFPLSTLLLINDANYPWFVLVPRLEGIGEIHELTDTDLQQLMRESSALSKKLALLFGARKMNIAALGNVVPQLHIHHIVRYEYDPAWPDPVWGKVPARPYTETERGEVIARLQGLQSDNFEFVMDSAWNSH